MIEITAFHKTYNKKVLQRFDFFIGFRFYFNYFFLLKWYVLYFNIVIGLVGGRLWLLG
jgi:hypothetical protein